MSTKRENSDNESPSEPENEVSNTFANDGSFLEMFKRRMEEQKRKQNKEESRTKSVTKIKPTPATAEAPKTGPSSLTNPKPPSSAPVSQKAAVNKPYQGFVGKRKALMKSIELREKRKRKREELEEQQLAEEEEGKGSAWKAYLAEVKAYEKRSCKDTDDLKRPLVK